MKFTNGLVVEGLVIEEDEDRDDEVALSIDSSLIRGWLLDVIDVLEGSVATSVVGGRSSFLVPFGGVVLASSSFAFR